MIDPFPTSMPLPHLYPFHIFLVLVAEDARGGFFPP